MSCVCVEYNNYSEIKSKKNERERERGARKDEEREGNKGRREFLCKASKFLPLSVISTSIKVK